MVLDYFEDLAVGIEEGVLDSVTARKLLCSALVSFWELLGGFVGRLREREGKKSFYESMEHLRDAWAK